MAWLKPISQHSWLSCDKEKIMKWSYNLLYCTERQKKRPQEKRQYFSNVKGCIFILSN